MVVVRRPASVFFRSSCHPLVQPSCCCYAILLVMGVGFVFVVMVGLALKGQEEDKLANAMDGQIGYHNNINFNKISSINDFNKMEEAMDGQSQGNNINNNKEIINGKQLLGHNSNNELASHASQRLSSSTTSLPTNPSATSSHPASSKPRITLGSVRFFGVLNLLFIIFYFSFITTKQTTSSSFRFKDKLTLI